MKFNILVLAAAILFLFSSCKKDVKEPEAQDKSSTTEVFEPNFIVEIVAKVSAMDDFAAYYTEDSSSNYEGSKAVWTGIDATDKFQTIKLNLPQEIVPTNIRLDFGLNKNQQKISIKEITMLYQGISFKIAGDKFFEYFLDTKEFPAIADPTNGTLEITYKAGTFKTPYFYPTEKLLKEIQTICYPQ